MFGSRKSRAGEIAKTAADVITANLMVADASPTITYMNRAVTRLLTDAEADIRKELPGFSVAKLIGSSIDAFFKDQGWNPYGDVPPPSATVGARGPDIYPLGDTRFATVVNPLPPAKPRRIRTAAAAPAPEPPPPVVPAPEGPQVPPPPSTDNGSPGATARPERDSPELAPGATTTMAPTVPKPPPSTD